MERGEDPAFYPKYLDGDPKKSKQDKVQVTVDPNERAMLEELKKLLDCPFDSKVLKMGLPLLKNILLGHLGEKTVKYICAERRRRKL